MRRTMLLQDVRRHEGYSMSGVQVRLPDRRRQIAKHIAVIEGNLSGVKVKETDIYRTLILKGLEMLEQEYAEQLKALE
jgi:hypothetical protein